MLFRTHLVFSLFVFILFFNFLEIGFVEKIVFGIFLLIATIFVDIDSTQSKLGSYWIFRPIQMFFSHRGMIHSLFTALVISFIIYLFSVSGGIGFFMGYLCHLFLDLFTKRGISFFWPVYKKSISFLRIKSGGVSEDVIFVLLLLCDVFLTVKFIFNIEF